MEEGRTKSRPNRGVPVKWRYCDGRCFFPRGGNDGRVLAFATNSVRPPIAGTNLIILGILGPTLGRMLAGWQAGVAGLGELQTKQRIAAQVATRE